MIWYNDEDIAIDFSTTPKVVMRYITPDMTKDEVDAITDYPFINKSNLDVYIYDKKKNKQYSFIIGKNYTWDGATIIKPLWSLIGSKTQPEFLIASMVHDVLCENHNLINNDRKLSTKVFNSLLLVADVPKWKANLMCFFVDLYQRIFW